jgi:hypothetical protein
VYSQRRLLRTVEPVVVAQRPALPHRQAAAAQGNILSFISHLPQPHTHTQSQQAARAVRREQQQVVTVGLVLSSSRNITKRKRLEINCFLRYDFYEGKFWQT